LRHELVAGSSPFLSAPIFFTFAFDSRGCGILALNPMARAAGKVQPSRFDTPAGDQDLELFPGSSSGRFSSFNVTYFTNLPTDVR
jgi:hypothetical protein